LSARTAGCIHRRWRSTHALLTLRAHVSASSWYFHSKHRITRLFIFSSLSTVPPPPHFLPPSSLSRVHLSPPLEAFAHERPASVGGAAQRGEGRGCNTARAGEGRLGAEGLRHHACRGRVAGSGGAAAPRAQGKGGWERRRNGVRGRGSAPHATRPGRARHRQGRRAPPRAALEAPSRCTHAAAPCSTAAGPHAAVKGPRGGAARRVREVQCGRGWPGGPAGEMRDGKAR